MDINALMKQAQVMQQKLQEAQARMNETEVTGTAGGGMVSVTLKGSGALTGVSIDDSLLKADEKEILADLLVAAHADAKKRLDDANADLMREAAGPLGAMGGGIPGMPKLF